MKRLAIPLLILASLPAWSDDGRIPIWEPTTITKPGSYYLTRDLQVDTGDGIVIEVTNVDLDLNGHTITGNGEGSGIKTEDLASDVSIRNGRLSGFTYGIQSGSSPPARRLRIEKLEITNMSLWGVQYGHTEYVEMIDCLIADATNGVEFQGWSVPLRGRIANNTLLRSHLTIWDAYGMEVRGNVITPSCDQFRGLWVLAGTGNRVVENVVVGGGCIGMALDGLDYNLLQDNVIVDNDSSGIRVDGSDGSQVFGNVVNEGGEHGISLIAATGEGPAVVLVDGNLAWDNQEFGLHNEGLDGAGDASSAYRNNMLRGNVLGPVSDPETALTNEGGNIE